MVSGKEQLHQVALLLYDFSPRNTKCALPFYCLFNHLCNRGSELCLDIIINAVQIKSWAKYCYTRIVFVSFSCPLVYNCKTALKMLTFASVPPITALVLQSCAPAGDIPPIKEQEWDLAAFKGTKSSSKTHAGDFGNPPHWLLSSHWLPVVKN